ncbi:MAG: M23 family metallopeptidase [Patescibacteria group bacterium]|nr:peptidoglycan DD-metalloendopeptidase family protein [Patescibacteria group bacterium]
MIKIRVKKFLAEILILLIKTLFLIKKIVVFILNYFIYKPLKAILSFFFFKIIINIYYKYILIYKKIKEINKKNNSHLYIFKKNYPIFILIIIGIILTFNSLSNNRLPFEKRVYKTALAQTIVSDFSVAEPEELIIESGYEERPSIIVQSNYIEQRDLIKNSQQVLLGSQNEENNILSGDSLNRPAIAQTPKARDARKEITEYTVQSGDTISSIAQDFGISVETILWENNLTSRSLIRPGNTLKILPQTGLMHVIAKNETISSISKKYSVSSDSIIIANNLDSEEVLKLNQKIFVPGGRKIIISTPASRPTYTGTSIAQSVPTTPSTNYSGGKLLWPTVGHRITQYYSWKHNGLDIANKTGTPLYAAESGTVERSGWNTGYGYNVVINHGGGLKTLYAHASKLHVKAGDEVNRGDIVADMGSTGWSTGPHIHFEVISNGSKQNPLNYIQ